VGLTKVGETADSIVVRGARVLATVAPFADELLVYPGSRSVPRMRFDHIQEKLGQIWSMSELARSAIVAAEAGASLDVGGVTTPDERPSSPCAARCRSGCRGSTSCCS
jgi:aromatic ring hydroxylase